MQELALRAKLKIWPQRGLRFLVSNIYTKPQYLINNQYSHQFNVKYLLQTCGMELSSRAGSANLTGVTNSP